MNPLISYLAVLFLISTFFQSNAGAGEQEPFPKLEKAVEDVRTFYKGNKFKFLAEKEYKVRKYYYQIQSKSQRLKILKEVKGHFEKAVTKAEEKFDSGEEEVSQSSITKLKLGLAGTLNDIIELESDIKVARFYLEEIFKKAYSSFAEMPDSEINPVAFKFNNYDTWFKISGLASFSDLEKFANKSNNELILKEGFQRIVETREKLNLARKNRKITRALLVSEVANYDFGIGDPGDLFEALVIYSRVLGGYYDSVYNFNLAVAGLNLVKASFLGKP